MNYKRSQIKDTLDADYPTTQPNTIALMQDWLELEQELTELKKKHSAEREREHGVGRRFANN